MKSKFSYLPIVLLMCFIGFSSNFVFGNIPASERQALIDFYNSTNGDDWAIKTGWKTPPLDTDGFAMPGTEGTWTGITVSIEHVNSISFYNNRLTGSLPSSLGNLNNLQSISLGGTKLSGNIPPELGNLSNLQVLDLKRNQFNGSIPQELGNLSNLQTLYLNTNQLSGSIPYQLGNLSNLKTLYLGYNQLSGSIPSQLGNLSNLEYLYLSCNQLSGSIPSELGNLSNLKMLEIYKNQLSGSIPVQLGNLSNLQDLALSDNQLRGSIPSQLGNLSNLKNLILSDNQLRGFIPAQLGNLSLLRILTLRNNQLYGEIPGSLKNLTLIYNESLDIRYNCGFTTTDTDLRTYLDTKNPGWETQQNQCNLSSLTLLSPNGSETFRGLTPRSITWSTTGTVSNVKIEYSIDGGAQWTTVVSSIPNTNSYNWNVPDTPSTNSKIRISDASFLIPSDTSDGVFTILPGQTITITSPIGAERWEVGTTHQISWNFANLTGNVRIDYTIDNGTTSWTAITYSTPINSSYNWLVPDTVSTQCKIRVTSLDVESVLDESNNTFSIYKEIPSPQRIALIALYNTTNGDSWIHNSGWKTPPLHTDGFAMPGTENSWYGISFAAENVYQINLQNNNLTGVLPDIFEDLFGLHFLYLNNNNLTGNIPASIGIVSTLEDIKLNNNQFTGSIPSSFNSLSILQYIDLSSNQLSGNSLTDLSSLSNLHGLNLSRNGFTFAIPSWIGSLTGLVNINFSNNLLTGTIPSQIGNLSNLNYLDLRYNTFEGEIPTTLMQLQNPNLYLDTDYNALYSSNSDLITYMNGKDQNWQNTQTIAPKNIVVSNVSGNSVTLNWDAILFTDNSGGYDVYYSTTAGGPYTKFGSTSFKYITTLTVTALQPSTAYYFVVRSRTEFDANRIVISGNSEEVPVITLPF